MLRFFAFFYCCWESRYELAFSFFLLNFSLAGWWLKICFVFCILCFNSMRCASNWPCLWWWWRDDDGDHDDVEGMQCDSSQPWLLSSYQGVALGCSRWRAWWWSWSWWQKWSWRWCWRLWYDNNTFRKDDSEAGPSDQIWSLYPRLTATGLSHDGMNHLWSWWW